MSLPATSSFTEIDTALARLSQGADDLATASLADRIRLTEAVLQRVQRTARDWVQRCCEAKSITTSHGRTEEILGGPGTVARYLRLLANVLGQIVQTGQPTLPGRVRPTTVDRLAVPVVPARGVFDALVFTGLRADVWMQRGVDEANLHGQLIDNVVRPQAKPIQLVLGAGNVSSIPVTDALSKLLQEGVPVLLKLNPVMDYLKPVFDEVFAPLSDRGWIQIVAGDGQTGAYACSHETIGAVHITGSHHTHDAIVWGVGDERAERKASNRPLLDKPMTSELGNVSPWIIVPGEYTERQLRFQATNIAASLTNNAGFNCLTTRAIVTSRSWPQRERFLQLLREALAAVPERVPYYPGARERYTRFSGRDIDDTHKHLPWTLLDGISPDTQTPLFTDESFVCICAEVPIPGSTETFLEAAVDFCNNRLFGTLCSAITVPDSFRRTQSARLERAIDAMNYGSVCLNQWPGLVYGLMTPPWGARPGGDLRDVQSGLGSVHNLYFLDLFDKTVFYGPLCNFPKPVWFPSHQRSEQIAWKLVDLFAQPGLGQLPGLLIPALRG
ncbi:MAG: aldehyde dehydrogenase family protein [Planctomycetaceae bacterium]|nr:aldehyde dehydrogenase family protein [Planctomycetaceae bacterium]